MTQTWNSLTPRLKAAWSAGLAALVILSTASAWWALRPQQAVLFADLAPEDAAVLAAELDRQKVPYAVAGNGGTLLVDAAQVHAVRLKLMGRELPLHGAVGFELFNASDFGMTEFAQKINYQRALQGELTRTILSFPEVRTARVHLALPEQGLFRQSSQPEAAVTLTLAAGQALRPEQVTGIQRLVAAAVPGLVAPDVTLVDQRGVALSRGGRATEEDGAASGNQLDLKRETEAYLSRKAGAVLERALGPGQAIASVDVTLNMDQVRTITEDVLPAGDGRATAIGVLVRERETVRDSAAPEPRGQDTRGARGSSMQRDADYQVGRRVEQVVSQAGSIRRLQVVAVVNDDLPVARVEQLRQLVGAAVGASPERGDTVTVQAFQAGRATPAPAAPTVVAGMPASAGGGSDMPALPLLVGSLLALTFATGLLWMRRQRGGRLVAPVRALSDDQRHLALGQVRAWLDDVPDPAAARPAIHPRSVA